MYRSLRSVTESNFCERVLEAKQTTLVVYWAPWAGPCRFFMDVLVTLAKEYPQVNIVKVHSDEEAELRDTYKVEALPTLDVFAHGIHQDRLVGNMPPNKLRAKLEPWLSQD